jgi:hypothetical protein
MHSLFNTSTLPACGEEGRGEGKGGRTGRRGEERGRDEGRGEVRGGEGRGGEGGETGRDEGRGGRQRGGDGTLATIATNHALPVDQTCLPSSRLEWL